MAHPYKDKASTGQAMARKRYADGGAAESGPEQRERGLRYLKDTMQNLGGKNKLLGALAEGRVLDAWHKTNDHSRGFDAQRRASHKERED